VSGPRRQAREAALQILYLWEVGRTDPASAIDAYFAEHAPDAAEAVRSFATALVEGTVADLVAIDAIVTRHSTNWRLDRLAVIDRLILRLAIWELRHAGDVPAAVVLNEAVELARRFSTDEAVRFVNGVLDAVRRAGEDETPAAQA
jgi:N utilization substance protein B